MITSKLTVIVAVLTFALASLAASADEIVIKGDQKKVV
jgi:hypothetical protein